MGDQLLLTILGCGSSPGTPRITGDWGNCDPANPKNRRMRTAALVERIAGNGGRTTVVIDTGPDFRAQMLLASVKHIDAVVYTHPHADHIHGIDDLRGFVLEQRRRIDIHADQPTMLRLRQAFGYCFETPPGSSYPPIVRPHLIDHARPVVIEGEGGPLTLEPLPQIHGDIISLGFRVGELAYCPDISDFPAATAGRLEGLDVLVIDALQYNSHPSHLSLAEALGWIEKLSPKNAVLTHMHVPLDYAAVMAETPDHVVPAYDGMMIEIPFESER
ncbi:MULTISPECIES: MBL fold metallo-hydrolase [unclassified Mesorhizobium]|uniref:MBL fold metallo-hydrolase n=3 Tax=Mesorhizobium TaxID=68287 RepID=UPI000BAF11BE|nr:MULTISPECIES: MBL fold metallo-hydrolase [unclassified Mesorhizobium]PBB30712.1 phosphoribosyl 1,2-cyclic phosphodiesterase [Mesorhizobium sp. WSM3882]RUU95819.1 MBL fold metallo-hydrolase [Mesorhizobium sp. M1A.F.Ca.IN.020.03.2.1]RUV87595.1 MBL fold metallo-hydrolase [Mesorhizobium sp. M1A.F.Ca.IN.020.32.1.1]RUW01431.1 MBL fold metallo-hydrolase [Mesorhizobium sp. M1A.F.Ca.IN.020.04.1.1]RUW12028.1 MBL fold metallo-hydrolase [Mesorhizobium sp. M1A.F.Ca.IN.020.03.1.1]